MPGGIAAVGTVKLLLRLLLLLLLLLDKGNVARPCGAWQVKRRQEDADTHCACLTSPVECCDDILHGLCCSQAGQHKQAGNNAGKTSSCKGLQTSSSSSSTSTEWWLCAQRD
jgi:hypothetical protein